MSHSIAVHSVPFTDENLGARLCLAMVKASHLAATKHAGTCVDASKPDFGKLAYFEQEELLFEAVGVERTVHKSAVRVRLCELIAEGAVKSTKLAGSEYMRKDIYGDEVEVYEVQFKLTALGEGIAARS